MLVHEMNKTGGLDFLNLGRGNQNASGTLEAQSVP